MEQPKGKWLSVALCLLALGVGAFSLQNSDENLIGGFGLIQVLPVIYYVCVAVVVGIMLLALRLAKQPTAILVTGILSLITLVDGAAAFVESAARFPVAWLHVGFVESILSLGYTTPLLDARMSWPGFFVGSGTLTDVVGADSATIFLQWAPVVLIWCYVPLLLVIGRMTIGGWRAPWAGVIIFIFVNWVGQDYFAPQTIGYIMYLALIATVLVYFRKTPEGPVSRKIQGWATNMRFGFRWLGSMITSGQRQFEPAGAVTTASYRVGLLGILAVISLALVTTHQLTPAVAIMALGAFAIVGRLGPWPLTMFMYVAMMGMLSYGAEAFWKGHLNDIFGGVGGVSESVSSGVTNRVQGSAAHLEILSARTNLALLMWGLAGLGALRLWYSARRVSVTLLIIAGMPIFLIAAQSYGGEGLLRVLLFSLPGAAMLIAALLLPTERKPGWRTIGAFGAGLALVFPMFLHARWGNETFERVSASDVELREAFYNIAPLGATLGTLAAGGASDYQNMTKYSYADTLLYSWPVDNMKKLNKILGHNSLGVFMLISRPQVANGVENNSIPADSGDKLIKMMVSSGQYRVVFQNSSGVILLRVAEPGAVSKVGNP